MHITGHYYNCNSLHSPRNAPDLSLTPGGTCSRQALDAAVKVGRGLPGLILNVASFRNHWCQLANLGTAVHAMQRTNLPCSRVTGYRPSMFAGYPLVQYRGRGAQARQALLMQQYQRYANVVATALLTCKLSCTSPRELAATRL